MNLNDKQKEYLKKINLPLDSKDRLKDINSFFELFGNFKEKLDAFPYVMGYVKSNKQDFVDSNIFRIVNKFGSAPLTRNNHSIIFANKLEIFYDTLYFLELWDLLDKNKLIANIDKDPNEIKEFKVPVLDKTIDFDETNEFNDQSLRPPYLKLWLLIKEDVLNEIVPLPDLNEFIKNDYKTREELKAEYEVEHNNKLLEISKNSLISYKRVSIVAIIISILLGVLNIISFTTERTVSISKDATKNDTNKVIIINKEFIKQDSIKEIK